MSLKKIYNLSEADDQDNTDSSNGVPQPVPERPRPNLSKLFGGSPAGVGPESDGVPQRIGPFDGPPQNAAAMRGPDGTIPTPGAPVDMKTAKVSYSKETIPNPRANPGGAGGPPKAAGAFSRAPNAPGNDDEPLPDLPIEGVSVRSLYLGGTVGEARGTTKVGLLELYSIDEMPRPAGSFGRAAMGMLKWAQGQAGKEFTKKDLFDAYIKAGGQSGQMDQNKAYQSFSSVMKKFVDPRGRGTPEQPLVMVQAGVQGSRKSISIYSWGSVRKSKAVGSGPMPGATPYDDMELGPAGAMDQGQDAQAAEPKQEPHGEPDAEPEQGAEEQPANDEYDWIPEADPETGVGRSMIALNEDDPEKLQELLAGVAGAETVMAAAQGAIKLYGRGTAMGSHAIKVAKSAAANLGLPDPDGVL